MNLWTNFKSQREKFVPSKSPQIPVPVCRMGIARTRSEHTEEVKIRQKIHKSQASKTSDSLWRRSQEPATGAQEPHRIKFIPFYVLKTLWSVLNQQYRITRQLAYTVVNRGFPGVNRTEYKHPFFLGGNQSSGDTVGHYGGGGEERHKIDLPCY